MNTKDFLVELGTEELPPKALAKLEQAFADGIRDGLAELKLSFESLESFATPRRLAVRLTALQTCQQDQLIERRGPAVQSAFDANGEPTKAALGFARSCGVESVDQLDRITTDKGEWLGMTKREPGQPAVVLLPEVIQKSLDRLPIPKRMRWADKDAEFVRPVQWLVMLLGDEVVPATLLGLTAGRVTRGHRFHCTTPITLASPSDYEQQLLDPGYVIVRPADRRALIVEKVHAEATALGGNAVIDPDLLDEVTALVEWPVPISGSFEERFLEVPAEALISSMQDHQRYFPVVDDAGKLMARFITVANLDSRDPTQVRAGNERVIRPRLTDAAFFWAQDKKKTLADRTADVGAILFQKQLGSYGQKVARVAALAGSIATMIDADRGHAERAATLCKNDLVSQMVMEFPELQGIMGRYYALADGESPDVAHAIEQHYWPRFSGDQLPESGVAQAVALADRVDTLLGIFAIGLQPTGVKDPFALRRAAIGVLRIIIERQLPVDLLACLEDAANAFPAAINARDNVDTVLQFVMDRLRTYYQDQGVSANLFDAVRSVGSTRPFDVHRRIEACLIFAKQPECDSLAAANKRVGNILKKADTDVSRVDAALLQEPSEKALYDTLERVTEQAEACWEARDYSGYLTVLSQLREPVDTFFDDVMVMADDEAIRNNRLALLAQMRNAFLRVADVSLLSQ